MSLREAVAGAQAALRNLAGELVEYRRGLAFVAVQAVFGETVFRLPDDEGIEVRVVMPDCLIEAGQLRLGGAQIKPQIGDRVLKQDGTVYQVLGPGGGEPEWRWSGPPGLQYRIHLKEIS
jgi:hypothetical protein